MASLTATDRAFHPPRSRNERDTPLPDHGFRLLGKLLEVSRRAGIAHVIGYPFSTNEAKKELARKAGLTRRSDPGDPSVTPLEIDLSLRWKCLNCALNEDLRASTLRGRYAPPAGGIPRGPVGTYLRRQ